MLVRYAVDGPSKRGGWRVVPAAGGAEACRHRTREAADKCAATPCHRRYWSAVHAAAGR